ncbi:MAG: ABC transporter substrate-binding protein [Proteobacteria bacterium]|nr:ABC transporter substrate-binding protein [Pseudomonadota bacterium]
MTALSRRHLLAAAGALAAAPARAQALVDVTYLTPFGQLSGYAPDYWGVTYGLFEKNGIRVKIVGGNGSAAAIQQVVAGQALICRTGGIDVVRAVSGVGAPIRAVGTIAHTTTFKVISAADAPVKAPKDLDGKTVGIVSAGGGTENYLDIMLAGAGIKRENVKRQVVGNSPGAFDLVKLKRLDAFIADTGVVLNLKARSEPIFYFDIDPYASVPGQVYAASDEGIAKFGPQILAYMRGVRAAMQAIAADTSGEATVKAIEPFKPVDMKSPELGLAAVRAEEVLWNARGKEKLAKIIPANWQSGWKEMEAAGLAKPGDPSKAYTTQFSDQL